MYAWIDIIKPINRRCRKCCFLHAGLHLVTLVYYFVREVDVNLPWHLQSRLSYPAIKAVGPRSRRREIVDGPELVRPRDHPGYHYLNNR